MQFLERLVESKFSDEETSRTFPAACRVAEGVLWPHAARRWSYLVLHGVST